MSLVRGGAVLAALGAAVLIGIVWPPGELPRVPLQPRNGAFSIWGAI